jgi:glycosyltransferase 2 family protein
MKKHFIISFVVGIFISIAALYFAFRHVPVSDLLLYLKSINYIWTVPAVFLVMVGFFLRTLRWRFILESSYKIGIWQAFHPLMIGFMINCILPGRLGELARPAILQKREKVPFATGIATVAAERVFDVSALIVFTIITLAFLSIDSQVEIVFGNYHLNRSTLQVLSNRMIIAGILFMAAVIMVSLPILRRGIHRLILAIPSLFFFIAEPVRNKLTEKVCNPLIQFVDNIALGFALIKYPRKIFICTLYSLGVWMTAAASYYFFSFGSPGIKLSFSDMFAVMVIICLFIALPSVPGFWGLWEAGGVFAMSLFGVPIPAAAGFTLANHAIQLFPVIVVGLISAVVTSVNVWQVSHTKEPATLQGG